MSKINLTAISWFASAISLMGIILNASKIIWCWPIWILSNIFWIYWAYKKREWALFSLWIVFSIFNMYGWYMWATI
jgi:nicotinamide mononucleotide transporter